MFFVFDLLYLDGYDLRGVPLIERKKLLKEVLKPGDGHPLLGPLRRAGAELLAAAKQQGIEGVVGKRASSLYESRRTSDWVKCKVANTSDFVIVRLHQRRAGLFGALVLGSTTTAS